MSEQLALSGKGSRVLEVDLPQGNYRLSWSAEVPARDDYDDGYDLYIVLETEKSNYLVIELLEQSDSGEVLARLPGGRHIFSVKASQLEWEITFTQL